MHKTKSMILPIYLYGSPVLREVAEKVDIEKEGKEALSKMLADMRETMKQADGCGLAAPQVGISKRVLVVDGVDLVDRFPELKGFARQMINPEIVEESEETSEYNEGCLSIPDVDADIVRPKTITVEYINENFELVKETFTDFAARMIQHEMDHLDGIVFTDHASQIRKKMISGKLHNIAKGSVRTHYKVKLQK